MKKQIFQIGIHALVIVTGFFVQAKAHVRLSGDLLLQSKSVAEQGGSDKKKNNPNAPASEKKTGSGRTQPGLNAASGKKDNKKNVNSDTANAADAAVESPTEAKLPENKLPENKLPENKLPETKSKGDGDENTLLDWLVPALSFVFSLIFTGIVFYLLNRNLQEVTKHIAYLQREVNAVRDSGSRVNQLQSQVDSFKQEFDRLRGISPAQIKAEILSQLGANKPTASPRISSTQPYDNDYETDYARKQLASIPQRWPVSVSALLKRMGGGMSAKRAYRADLLIETQETSEESIYVVSYDPESNGLHLVVPSHPRFQSSQDFHHYSTFYDCDRPTAGEVWVVEPAHASYDDGAGCWRLHRKGRLQIN